MNVPSFNQTGNQTGENEGLTRRDVEEALSTNMWCGDARHGVVEQSVCWLVHTARLLGARSTTDPIEPPTGLTTFVAEFYS